jgi:hypothetical protein
VLLLPRDTLARFQQQQQQQQQQQRHHAQHLLHLAAGTYWTCLQGLNVQVWREYEDFVKELSSK